MSGKYDDIIHLPHHVSRKHPRMSNHDRAAQFSPFAALTGFEAKINETARLTDRKLELDDYAKAQLDAKLQELRAKLSQKPPVRLTYFKADERKEGGAYVQITALVWKIDPYERCLHLFSEETIPIDDIYELDFTDESVDS